MFLWHFLSGCPAWVLPSTLPGGARTFLPGAQRAGAAAQSTQSGSSLTYLLAPYITPLMVSLSNQIRGVDARLHGMTIGNRQTLTV